MHGLKLEASFARRLLLEAVTEHLEITARHIPRAGQEPGDVTGITFATVLLSFFSRRCSV